MSLVELNHLKSWAKAGQVFLDVRSPGEFEQGHLPGAINIPILNDEERALIGTTYKTKGREEAVRLGHEVVSGNNRNQKLEQWKKVVTENPNVVLTCFRGGLRSQITRAWLKEAGFDRPLIDGGYKACRQLLIDKMQSHCDQFQFLIVSGPTGAAKTHFLHDVSSFWPTLDLEAYANHRGSAFGKMELPQPQQAVFENQLAWDLLKIEDQAQEFDLPILVEDESRLIGRCVQPEYFFNTLRSSPVVWLDVPLERRVENTFQDYVAIPLSQKTEEQGRVLFFRFKKALYDIRNRLGGVRYQEISDLMQAGEFSWVNHKDLEPNKLWVHRLLEEYYDPMYFGSLEKRNPEIYFKGPTEEAFEVLKGAKSRKRPAPVRQKAQNT